MRRMARTLQQNQPACRVLRESDSTPRGLNGVSFTMDHENRAADAPGQLA